MSVAANLCELSEKINAVRYRDWSLITGRGGVQNGRGGMQSFIPMQGGRAEKVLAMLKWGGGGGGTTSFGVVFTWKLDGGVRKS